MMITEYLKKENIQFNIDAENFEDLLKQMLQVTKKSRTILLKQIMQRESLMSTCLGKGVALPRVIVSDQEKSKIIIAINKKGYKFKSLDLLPVQLIVLHIFSRRDNYAALLAQSLRLMNDDNLRDEIINSASEQEVIEAITDWEEEE